MGSNHTGDGFLFDMAIEEADSETVEWLGGQEYYQKWKKRTAGTGGEIPLY